jgi:hypothetical protein
MDAWVAGQVNSRASVLATLTLSLSLPRCACKSRGINIFPAALAAFTALPATAQRQYNLWIGTAKREDTRQRRIAEALELLAAGKRLGLR